jgi:hypothetical protein
MTLPDTPFVCKNIDVEAARDMLVDLLELGVGIRDVDLVIAAALGEVIPTEVETHNEYKNGPPRDCCERYVTPWQPVVSLGFTIGGDSDG